MKKFTICVSVLFYCLFVFQPVAAQAYSTGVGIRIDGLMTGFTLKHFITKHSAAEGMISIGHKSIIAAALFEQHLSFKGSPSLNFYYGTGMHVSFFKDGGRYYNTDRKIYNIPKAAGIDFIAGIDYKFSRVPISFSMDFKPFIDFVDGAQFYHDGSISVRYTF